MVRRSEAESNAHRPHTGRTTEDGSHAADAHATRTTTEADRHALEVTAEAERRATDLVADAEREAAISARIPADRYGKPEEAAPALFLASDDSGFCAGGSYAVERPMSAG